MCLLACLSRGCTRLRSTVANAVDPLSFASTVSGEMGKLCTSCGENMRENDLRCEVSVRFLLNFCAERSHVRIGSLSPLNDTATNR